MARSPAPTGITDAGSARGLPAGLLAADAYPHAVAAVELAETHISWVFLAGDCAYKVKKPVRLDFLDFSTLELRRHFCEEELRLNRHFAPELYLGVSTVNDDGQRIAIDGPGRVVDYAVRMRRFERRQELDAILARGAADAALLAGFGADLSALHSAAPVATPDVEAAATEAAIAANRDNFSALRRLLPADLAPRLEALATWSEDKGRELAPLLARRAREGRCRECHGDLHAANIVCIDGRLVAFDALEFDPALRWIDVASDLAFLLMDLGARGHDELASAALDGWLSAGGDFEALAVLPWFMVYRALVRAKVAAIRHAAPGAGDGGREALHYLDEAARHALRHRPMLIITHGVSGSGKSRLAAGLLAPLGAVRLRSDVERKRLAGLPALASSGGTIYTPAITASTYRRLQELATIAIGAGYTAIVDAAFLREAERSDFAALAGRLGVPFRILSATAPRQVLESRLAARRGDPSEAGAAVLALQVDTAQPLTPAERQRAIEVDTSEALDSDDLARRLRTTKW